MNKKFIIIGSVVLSAVALSAIIIFVASSKDSEIKPELIAQVVTTESTSAETSETTETTTEEFIETTSEKTSKIVTEVPEESAPVHTKITTRVIHPMQKLPPSIPLLTLATVAESELHAPLVITQPETPVTTAAPPDSSTAESESTLTSPITEEETTISEITSAESLTSHHTTSSETASTTQTTISE